MSVEIDRMIENERAEKAARRARLIYHIQQLVDRCHNQSVDMGWWDGCPPVHAPAFNYAIGTKFALVHSEVSEALEGFRKSLDDNHLPQYPMVLVEIADAIIRLCDIAGKLDYEDLLGAAIFDKLEYNAKREDHKREVRQQAGGKSV